MISPAQYSAIEVERLYRVLAAHESGHVVLYKSCRVESAVSFEFDDLGCLVGGTTIPNKTLWRFDSECVSWGGVVAEYLSGYILTPVPGIPALSEETVDAWARAVWPALSATHDGRAIGSLRGSEQAVRTTLRTLSSSIGSRLLADETARLVEMIRGDHAEALKRAGRGFPAGSREAAQEIYSVLEGP